MSAPPGSDFSVDFDWRDRSLSGVGASARAWAGGLSALTGVAGLDATTLLPWAGVFAPRGLFRKGAARWCPECFGEDREEGRSPYFRLAWDLKVVTVCERHGTRLSCTCPECGRENVRHRAAYVVPGWCTSCGAFLGERTTAIGATPEALWISGEIGKLLRVQAALMQPAHLAPLQATITQLVARMDGGNAAAFGARIGVAKSTVHYWIRGKTAMTLGVALRIAVKIGLPLVSLLLGDLDGWVPPKEVSQLNLDLELGSRGREQPARVFDWVEIRKQLLAFTDLPEPVSLAEAARRLGIDPSYLYLRANKEARIVGARWAAYVKLRGEENRARAREEVRAVCDELRGEGRALNLRELQPKMSREGLAGAKHLFDVLRDLREDPGQPEPG